MRYRRVNDPFFWDLRRRGVNMMDAGATARDPRTAGVFTSEYFTHPIDSLIQRLAAQTQGNVRPIVFPPNSPLGRLQRKSLTRPPTNRRLGG